MKFRQNLLLLPILIFLVAGCSDDNKVGQPKDGLTVDGAKKAREIFVGARGDWDQTTATQRADFIKFTSSPDESRAKMLWGKMNGQPGTGFATPPSGAPTTARPGTKPPGS